MKPSRTARARAGGRNLDGFTLPARSCYVVGVDTKHGPEHPLFKARAADVVAGRRPYDERMLRSMAKDGVLEAIRVQLVQVAADDTLWPMEARGEMVHVVLLGGHRIVHFRKVLKTAPVGSDDAWQVRCVLDTDRDPRRQVAVQIAENVCRRVLDDDERAQTILQGINIGLTIDELAEQLGITVAKAKRLQRRAEGAPEKPKEKKPRVPAAYLDHAVSELYQTPDGHYLCNSEVVQLIECMRGQRAVEKADKRVRKLLGVEDSKP